uniref:ATP synthase complex subunit 8 n=1 Tax=Aporia potanini intercostata TaxID=3056515 RepID=A0A088B0Z0_9NEOP|nr:ATP synthase F0 subunit 8 [Aporia potanini intercostata]AGG35776.1 ATP synthase F0 subunit 8 [Aporia potanini intercostata]
MPQMMPINWMFYFIFFLLIFLLFNIMNYYIFFNINFKYKNMKLNKKIINWKW